MATGPASMPPAPVDSREIRQYLDKVLASASFASAPRVRQFLRFVVEETLEGHAGEIKESVVAVHVFGRTGDFDSHSDSVVRVQATHLRKRLREYYRVEGAGDGVIIELPPGAYVPVFRPGALPGAPADMPAAPADLPGAPAALTGAPAALLGAPAALTGAPAALPGAPTHPFRRWWLLPVAALLFALAAAVLWTSGWPRLDYPTSIAVLPFAWLGAAPYGGYLAEGIAEDLMTSLARSPGLRVAARTSAFQFRGTNLGARAVGRELGARVLLDGTIRGNGNRLKITAHLVDATGEFDLWSDSWEGSADDVALFEDRVAAAVRQTLGKPLDKRQAAAAIRPPAPAAQEPYWRGRILLSKAVEFQSGSIPFLEQAVQADPQYAPAHAALATALAMGLYHGTIYPRDEPLRRARREAARALELDPVSAEASASLALLSSAFDHDWPAAQRGFEKALEWNPSDARAHLLYAMGLVTRGRFSQAVAHVDQARVLDPLSFAASNYLAIALYCAGRYDESIAAARHSLAADPAFASAHVAIARGLAMKGDSARAAAEFDLAIQKFGRQPWILGRMGYALGRAGHTAPALAIVREIAALEGPAVQTAFVYAGLGDSERALDALDKAFDAGDIDLNFMAVDPMLSGLRAEPRFLKLKSRMGL